MKSLILSILLQVGCPETIYPDLVVAMIVRESNGHHDSVSSAGAMGLLQVKPIVLDDYNREYNTNFVANDLFSPKINLRVGLWHLCRYKFATKFKTELLQIYFTGYARWKEMKRDADHPLWVKVNGYTSSIYRRYFFMKSLCRLGVACELQN